MRKILLILLALFLSSSLAYCLEEEILPEKLEEIELEFQDDTFLSNILRAPKDVIELKVEKNDVVTNLLKKQTTIKFEDGPLESLHTWAAFHFNFNTTIPQEGDNDTLFKASLVNIILDGKFRGGKENFRILLDPTSIHDNFFQHFLRDIYVESKRIPHHTIVIGHARTASGIEGGQSPFTLPFAQRSQISRNLGNVRKLGIRIKGDYALIDYDLGGFSSDTFWQEFLPGVEFVGWANLKPLGLTDGKWGKIKAGGGIVSGENNGINYFQTGAALSYEYKNLWSRFEWASSDGSNGGSGLTQKRADGLYGAIGYFITPKTEILARYDQFRPDRSFKNNYQREYTAGLNYYIKGQGLRVLINYIYAQNDLHPDSHKIIVGTQILL